MTIEVPQTAMARRCLSVLALSAGLALAGCGGGQTAALECVSAV